jgi:hypothetical protein
VPIPETFLNLSPIGSSFRRNDDFRTQNSSVQRFSPKRLKVTQCQFERHKNSLYTYFGTTPVKREWNRNGASRIAHPKPNSTGRLTGLRVRIRPCYSGSGDTNIGWHEIITHGYRACKPHTRRHLPRNFPVDRTELTQQFKIHTQQRVLQIGVISDDPTRNHSRSARNTHQGIGKETTGEGFRDRDAEPSLRSQLNESLRERISW